MKPGSTSVTLHTILIFLPNFCLHLPQVLSMVEAFAISNLLLTELHQSGSNSRCRSHNWELIACADLAFARCLDLCDFFFFFLYLSFLLTITLRSLAWRNIVSVQFTTCGGMKLLQVFQDIRVLLFLFRMQIPSHVYNQNIAFL